MFNDCKLNEAERILRKRETSKFYATHLVELPSFSQWRQFRFRLWDVGKDNCYRWMKLRDTIRTPEQMQKHLVKFAPRDVYFMTSRFLNPQNIGPKKFRHQAGFKWAYNIFLGSELYFDFDEKDIVSVLAVREYLMSKYGFQQVEVYETSRGYHLHCMDFEDKVEKLKHLDKYWKYREEIYQSEKRKVAADLEKQGYKFDKPITIDTRRIIRVVGSVGNDMFVKTRVKTEELK
jgi:hypothetical protein